MCAYWDSSQGLGVNQFSLIKFSLAWENVFCPSIKKLDLVISYKEHLSNCNLTFKVYSIAKNRETAKSAIFAKSGFAKKRWQHLIKNFGQRCWGASRTGFKIVGCQWPNAGYIWEMAGERNFELPSQKLHNLNFKLFESMNDDQWRYKHRSKTNASTKVNAFKSIIVYPTKVLYQQVWVKIKVSPLRRTMMTFRKIQQLEGKLPMYQVVSSYKELMELSQMKVNHEKISPDPPSWRKRKIWLLHVYWERQSLLISLMLLKGKILMRNPTNSHNM